MTAARVQIDLRDTVSASSVTMSFGAAPTQGNLLVAFGHNRAGVNLTAPTGYTLVFQHDQGSNLPTLEVYAKIAGASEASTLLLDWGSGNRHLGGWIEYSGTWPAAVADAIDVSTGLNSSTTDVSSQSTGTTGTSDAAAALQTVFLSANNGALTGESVAWTNSFVDKAEIGNGGSTRSYMGMAQKFATGAATYESTASWTTAVRAAAIIAVFKEAGGGSGQTVTPTGIGSAEAHGVATVTGGPVTVTPTGIASAETHGTATLTTGSVNLAPTGIVSGEAHGSPTLTTGAVILTPTGIGSAEAFGTTTVAAGGSTVSPSGIGSLEAFGAAVVAAGAVTVAPGGIASGEAFGTATVSSGGSFVQPSGIASAEAFGTAVASSGVVTIAPTGIASTEAIGALAITTGSVTLIPTGISSGEAFGTAAVADPDAARDIHITGTVGPTLWAAVALHKSMAATVDPTPWSAT